MFLAASPQSHPILGLDTAFEIHFSWGKTRALAGTGLFIGMADRAALQEEFFQAVEPFSFWKLYPVGTNLASSD